MRPAADMTGLKFGRLTVIKRVADRIRWKPTWECICVCGKTCTAMGANLRGGYIKSCGCLARENIRKPLPPKPYCKAGHKMTRGNTYLYSRGQRVCKICERARRNQRYSDSKLRAGE